MLQALQDLGSHFGREAGLSGDAAAAAPAAAPGEDAPEPPRQRIGKASEASHLPDFLST